MPISPLLAILVVATTAPPDSAAGESQRFYRKRRGQLLEQRYQIDIDGQNTTLLYELFIPNSCGGTNGRPICNKAPVLVFLHGRGESGSYDVTNAQSLPWLLQKNNSFMAEFGFITAIPQCPLHCAEINMWDSLVLRSITSLVDNFLLGDVIGGDRSRVFLTGQSMGGNGAWVK